MIERARSKGRDLEGFLCFAIYSAGHAFTRFYKPLLDELALTYPQYLVMLALWAEGDRTVGALGKELCLESSTLTPLLKRMEGMGLVVRRRNRTDERQVRVSATPAGLALRTRAARIPKKVLEGTGLTPQALGRLATELAKVRESLLTASRD